MDPVMEADDSKERSVSTSSDSYDGGPAAVRRRLDLEGTFISTACNRTSNMASDQRRDERTPVTSHAKETDDDSSADESLLEATLVPHQECDTSVADTSHSGSCRNVSQGDLVIIGVEHVVEVVASDIAGQQVDKIDRITLSIVSTQSTARGVGNEEGEIPSASCISPGEQQTPQIHPQEANAVRCSSDQWKFHEKGNRTSSNNEGGRKHPSETDVSCTNGSSGGSSSGFYGDIDEADFTGSLASSEDLLELFENSVDAILEEEARAEETADDIGSRLEKVSSKIGYLHEIAAKILSSYCVPEDEAVISEKVGDANAGEGSSSSEFGLCSAATGEPSSHHTTDNEARNSTVSRCTSDGRCDISSEDRDSCHQRFMAVKDYVISVSSSIYEQQYGITDAMKDKWRARRKEAEDRKATAAASGGTSASTSEYNRPNTKPQNRNSGDMEDQRKFLCEMVEDSEATAASRGASSSSSEDNRPNTKTQIGTSERKASTGSQIDDKCTARTDKDYIKKVRNTCKSVQVSQRIVSRQFEIMSRIGGVALQRVRKLYVTCPTIFNCVKTTVNVVSTAVQAKRVARLCLQEATTRAGSARSTALQVAKAAISASRFAREAVTFAEKAVQLHEEAAEALREAESTLQDIETYELNAGYVLGQVSGVRDEVDEMIQQTSNMSLQVLEDDNCFVESNRSLLSSDLKEVKKESTSIENVTNRCDRILSDTSHTMRRATRRSVKAIDAALEALQAFKSLC